MATINVRLGERGYPIRVGPGLLDSLGQELAARRLDGPLFVVSSPRIHRLHGRRLMRGLRGRDSAPTVILVPEGEQSKSLETAARIYTRLIRAGADRSAVLAAFGGGVIGDLSGFVAATYLRGVRLVQVPTTLLAQIDSAIGGKVGINHPSGKNLIGAFFQPRLVAADPRVLQTLPAGEWRSGLFEAVKYGIIADARLFRFMEQETERLLLRDPEAVTRLIESCCRIKARVVSLDERESQLRMILNLGHTVGHALESVAGYGTLKHGDAVGWGMLFAIAFARDLGLLSEKPAARIRGLIECLGLPRVNSQPADKILAAMQRDKKRTAGAFRLILPERIGRVVVHETRDRRAVVRALKASGLVASS